MPHSDLAVVNPWPGRLGFPGCLSFAERLPAPAEDEEEGERRAGERGERLQPEGEGSRRPEPEAEQPERLEAEQQPEGVETEGKRASGERDTHDGRRLLGVSAAFAARGGLGTPNLPPKALLGNRTFVLVEYYSAGPDLGG